MLKWLKRRLMTPENRPNEYLLGESKARTQWHQDADKRVNQLGDQLQGIVSDELDQMNVVRNSAKEKLDNYIEIGHNEALLENYARDKKEFSQLKRELNELVENEANNMQGKEFGAPGSQLTVINDKFTHLEEKHQALLSLGDKLAELGIKVD